MTTTISPYLTFDGNAREAMTFYRDALGGELSLMAVKDTNMGSQCMGTDENAIMHSSLIKDSLVLMASDMIGNRTLQLGNNFAISVNCSSEEEINTFYKNISAGGEIIDPLKIQFWGALFGVVKDKFGMVWMFNFDKNS
ncbi:VOC family protein [Pedobacter sp. MR2016-24]|uniref:VOC family protein n=1 Tax=Pedobacter sp. MR2016-24 TaxID=2994466 RepID=UPI002245A698|nr:VOC family protein [Pedobacter sp. MR2016-24]MCX2484572.1 VOC family protein [Pedobacter sp. MR2016-24]